MNRQEKFQNQVTKFVTKHRNTIKSDNHYDYCIETIYGKLFISLHSLDCEIPLSKLYSVFCRFEFPELVTNKNIRNQMNLNSGKWNFHNSDRKIMYNTFKGWIAFICLKNQPLITKWENMVK